MNQNSLKPLLEAVRREPYRIFFPLGIVMGTVGVGHWLFYALGWLKTYSGFFHSSLQMLVYMNCFIAGFLMTFIPRFTGTSHASGKELFSFLLLLVGMALFLGRKWWMAAEVGYLLWLFLLTLFVVKRIPKRFPPGEKKTPPTELLWIPVALFHGVIGTILLLLGQLGLLPRLVLLVGKPMMEQGFLLSIVIGIGGFLIPRITGTFRFGKPVLLDMGCVLGLVFSFGLEGMGYPAAAYGIRASAITAAFIKAGIVGQLPQNPPFYARLAWISAWMIVSGYWMAALLSDYRLLALHIAFLGGFSLMTFAIATMVIFSHAGAAERLRRPLWILWVVAAGIALAVIKRSLLVLYTEAYFTFLGIASFLWIITALCWLIYMIPYLLKLPQQDGFGKMHEEMRKRLVSG